MAAKRKTKPESTALAVQDEQAIAEAFGGADAYQIPTDAPLPRGLILRESGQFEMPGGDLAKSFEGHVILWHEANTYWSSAFGEGDTSFPDCCSSDGAFPNACAYCPRCIRQSDRISRPRTWESSARCRAEWGSPPGRCCKSDS